LDAVGVAGNAFTTTFVVPATLAHPPTVTVTLYVPDIATVDAGRVGFCSVEVYPPGPLHAYVAPATVGVDNVIVAPAQYGPVLDAVGAVGVGFTTTVVVAIGLVHDPTVIVTL
jgi:hypothetical protein